MPCLACGRDFHDECEYEDCNECHPDVEKLVKTFTATGASVKGAPIKNPQDVTDPKSTGRKRAAQLYPIFEDAPCEWQGKKNCGGGKYPIIGCINGKQRHRHHGPVKNTLRNEPGNVHRICHECVVPTTMILTENLEWIAANQLRVGDRLIGFTESYIPFKRTSHQVYGAKDTIFEPSTIESIATVIKPSYRFTMQNGATLTSSYDHLWVGSSSSDAHILWRRTDRIKRYDYINHLVDPWDVSFTWNDGWLAGYLDGEGCLSGYQLSVAQKLGNVSDISSDMINNMMKGKLHYTYRPRVKSHHLDTEVYRVTNLPDIMSILGTVRPFRLLDSFPEFLYGKNALMGRASRKVRVENVEFVGETELISIQTSSKTFFADGFYSHNCHNRWHARNDAEYDEMEYAKLPHAPVEATEMEILASDAKWRIRS